MNSKIPTINLSKETWGRQTYDKMLPIIKGKRSWIRNPRVLVVNKNF